MTCYWSENRIAVVLKYRRYRRDSLPYDILRLLPLNGGFHQGIFQVEDALSDDVLSERQPPCDFHQPAAFLARLDNHEIVSGFPLDEYAAYTIPPSSGPTDGMDKTDCC